MISKIFLMNDSFSITLVKEEKLFHLTNVIKDEDLLKRNWYNGIRIPAAVRNVNAANTRIFCTYQPMTN